MKGLDLAKEYFDAYGGRILSCAGDLDPKLPQRLSAGLAGEGSQCFGYDDCISQDHDFAPGFCIFMSDEDSRLYGAVLQDAYDSLPDTFRNYSRSSITAADRLGVMSVSEFYGRFTGLPRTEEDWLLIPEANLAAATNGQLWLTGCAPFAEVRELLLGFYPEGALRKKLAARAAVMSQAGQYNLLRMLEREDQVAASLAAARFTEAAISMVHLLSRRYTPFYKWAFRSLQELAADPQTGADSLAAQTVLELAKLPEVCILPGKSGKEKAFEITEAVCGAVAEELRKQGFSQCSSRFLQDHLAEISQGEDFTYGYY